MKGVMNLQDVFLNQVRRESIPVTMFLTNGFQIKGKIKGFDGFTVVIDSDGMQQMVYKHAISTLVPARPVTFMSGGDRSENTVAEQ